MSFAETEAKAFLHTSLKEYVTPQQIADQILFITSVRGKTISDRRFRFVAIRKRLVESTPSVTFVENYSSCKAPIKSQVGRTFLETMYSLALRISPAIDTRCSPSLRSIAATAAACNVRACRLQRSGLLPHIEVENWSGLKPKT